MRLLGILRLSDLKDESASIEQQKKMLNDYADSHGHTIIFFVEDTDISGSYGPFHAKRSIGPWLTDKQSEYDGIICRAINRIARNAAEMLRLIRWAGNRDKVIISVKDGIDTTTDAGKTMAKLMAVVAEMELDQIKSRAKDAHQHLTQVQLRWRGMQAPFGYMPTEIEPGKNKGYKLIHDPKYGPILQDLVARYLKGESLGELARWLNSENIPTSRNISRIRNGKPVQPAQWTNQTVRNVLSSHSMLGAIEVTEPLEYDDETGQVTKRSERKALRDENGDLVLRAEPLVSFSDWSKVQAMLGGNPGLGSPHVHASPLLHVAYCGVSGDPMYTTSNKSGRNGQIYFYYRCRKADHGDCPSKRFRADWLEQVIPQTVLETVGHMPYMIPHIEPAEEYSSALAQAEDARNNLLELAEGGAFKGRTEVFAERMDAIESRIADLKSRPSRAESKEWRDSHTTIAAHWDSLNPDDRWQFLREMNVKAYVARGQLPDTFGAIKQSGTTNAPDIPTPLDIPVFVMVSDAKPTGGVEVEGKIYGGESEWTDKTVHVTIVLGTLRDMAQAFNESAERNQAKS
jgi:site-specific DNA recombinase